MAIDESDDSQLIDLLDASAASITADTAEQLIESALQDYNPRSVQADLEATASFAGAKESTDAWEARFSSALRAADISDSSVHSCIEILREVDATMSVATLDWLDQQWDKFNKWMTAERAKVFQRGPDGFWRFRSA